MTRQQFERRLFKLLPECNALSYNLQLRKGKVYSYCIYVHSPSFRGNSCRSFSSDKSLAEAFEKVITTWEQWKNELNSRA